MEIIEPLINGKYYHIYNHGVGGRNLFASNENFAYFLKLYDKYLSIVADTYAWVLMPNHFHLLMRVKEEKEILKNLNYLHLTGFENLSGVNLSGVNNNSEGLKPIYQYFSNLFNAYTKAFNKYHSSRGALFERRFKRKLIDSAESLKRVVIYIHNNPVHHGFCRHPADYPWSSYNTCLSAKPTRLNRDEVMYWFENVEGFRVHHHDNTSQGEMDRWLEVI